MRLFLRLVALSCLGLIGLSPAGALAVPTYQIGAAVYLGPDLPPVNVPLVDVLGGYTSPPDEAGVAHWTMGAARTIEIGGETFGQITSWTADLKEDPFITNNINITNDTEFTIVYNAIVSMPLAAFAYNAIVNSSVGVTATDSDGNNIMLVDEDGGLAFYRGRVNGGTLLSLTPPAIPITTADCSPFPNDPGCTATSATGVPFQAAGPGVANDIEIILHFVLSPGDSVGITSRFEIVPEPTTGLLLGLGLFGLAVARRQSH